MFTEKERKLLAALLTMAAEEFSNHGCNDFDVREYGLTPDDCHDLWKKLAVGDDPTLAERRDPYFQDWHLMGYFASRIEKMVDR